MPIVLGAVLLAFICYAAATAEPDDLQDPYDTWRP